MWVNFYLTWNYAIYPLAVLGGCVVIGFIMEVIAGGIF